MINLKFDVTRIYKRDHKTPQILDGSVVSGIHSDFVTIDTTLLDSVLGVQFKPGGAFPFFETPAGEIKNLHLSLDTFWGKKTADLRDKLLDANTPEKRFGTLENVLLAKVYNTFTSEPAVEYALREFENVPTVAKISDLLDQVGYSKKRFIQLFTDRVGLTPKLFCRVRRFQSALQTISKGGQIRWADIAVDCGYFDQAHFIRDFTGFSGITPSSYINSRTEYINHVQA